MNGERWKRNLIMLDLECRMRATFQKQSSQGSQSISLFLTEEFRKDLSIGVAGSLGN